MALITAPILDSFAVVVAVVVIVVAFEPSVDAGDFSILLLECSSEEIDVTANRFNKLK